MGKRIRGTVEKLVPGGEGLLRIEGRVVFAPGVCPGELVSAEISDDKKGWARCSKVEIIEASPARREPFCPLFGRCGGCSWQYLDYDAQIKAKEAFVRESLTRQGGMDPDSISDFRVTSSRPTSYRARIRPVILAGGKGAFRAQGRSTTVAVDTCPVAVDGINRFLSEGTSLLKAGDEPIIFGNQDDYWAEGLDEYAWARLGGKEFRFPPGAFFQSNLDPLEDLIAFVTGAAEGESALDLFGGVGLFGAFLADHFEKVTGVDADSRAEAAWRRHVGQTGEFYPMRLEDWVRSSSRSRADYVVVDPPRRGLSKTVREALISLKSPKLAYVSCDPITQARDLKEFLAAGYRLKAFGIFDLYPQTSHVETAAILELSS